MGRSKVGAVSSLVVCAGSAAVVLIFYNDASPGERVEWASAIALAAPIFGAGVVGFIGASRSHGTLMVAAGMAVAPMSVVSIALLPLLVPAIALIKQVAVNYEPWPEVRHARATHTELYLILIVAVLVGAFMFAALNPGSGPNIGTNVDALHDAGQKGVKASEAGRVCALRRDNVDGKGANSTPLRWRRRPRYNQTKEASGATLCREE